MREACLAVVSVPVAAGVLELATGAGAQEACGAFQARGGDCRRDGRHWAVCNSCRAPRQSGVCKRLEPQELSLLEGEHSAEQGDKHCWLFPREPQDSLKSIHNILLLGTVHKESARVTRPQSFPPVTRSLQVGGRVLPFQLDGREFIRRMAGLGTNSGMAQTLLFRSQFGQSKTNLCATLFKTRMFPITALFRVSQRLHPFQLPASHPAVRPAEAATAEDSRQNGALCLAIPSGGVRFNHTVMNLPASAVEFLDAFKGSFHRENWQQAQLPLVHVYTFAKSDATDQGVLLSRPLSLLSRGNRLLVSRS